MSFSSNIKKEIIKDLKNNNDKLSLLQYYLIFKSNILQEDIKNIKISVKHIYILEFLKETLKKNYDLDFIINDNKYIIINDNFKKLKKDILKLYENINDEIINKDIFIKSIFITRGSINDPLNNQYHLEFRFNDFKDLLIYQKILLKNQIEAKLTKRENRFILYVKNSEQISDFLKLLKTNQALFYFENIKLERQIQTNAKRISNIEVSNLKKQTQNSFIQTTMIKKIIKDYGYNNLDNNLKEIIDLRLEFENESLNELVLKYKEKYKKEISKSGLNHRFKKIKEIYQNLIK